MAKSAFTPKRRKHLCSLTLLAVLIWLPILRRWEQHPWVSGGSERAPSFVPAAQLHTSRLTPHVLKHTKASSSTPALHSTQVTPQYRCSIAAVTQASWEVLSFTPTEARTEFWKCPHFKIFISIPFKNIFVFITQNTLWFNHYYVPVMDEKSMHGRTGTHWNSSLIQFSLLFLFKILS